jgi:hypothetical protein
MEGVGVVDGCEVKLNKKQSAKLPRPAIAPYLHPCRQITAKTHK